MKSDNHYEAAFEAYLRSLGVAVVPVVEARRSYLDQTEVKSPDFIVVGPDDARLVVDVKGRKFPGGPSGSPRLMWENWSTREDIDGLARWAGRLGDGFRGVLAFVYEVLPVVYLPPDTPDLFAYRDRLYLARGVCVADYRDHMTARSPRWGTVHLPADDFRRLVRPFSAFLRGTAKDWPADDADFVADEAGSKSNDF
ncbi:MAG: HYExAFE family protein [Gemmataceae bacterium]|nr:HYExAFE family protein [Gemmataceae bacterium]